MLLLDEYNMSDVDSPVAVVRRYGVQEVGRHQLVSCSNVKAVPGRSGNTMRC